MAAGSASTFFPSFSNLVMVSAQWSGQTLVRLMGVGMNDGGGEGGGGGSGIRSVPLASRYEMSELRGAEGG